jgi:hypothetical protein
MGLTMDERKAVTRQQAPRYQQARKKDRGRILDEFTALTDYKRSYAAFLLRNWGRKRILTIHGIRTICVFGQQHKRKPSTCPRRYDHRIIAPLKFLWALSSGLCGKRLAVFIRTTLPILERFEELPLDADTRQKLLSVSPATIDRLLAPERKKLQLKARATTKPGTLLKHQIPIRTFSQWDDRTPGFVEIDLVAHDGGIPASDVIHTLDLTDVATGWTETRALKTKAQRWVLQALADISQQLPFPIKGIDCDNGGEFINAELFRYCQQCHITFTRSRPYRKNDSCFVEEKNYSIVRKAVGYSRYDSDEELKLLEQLYCALRLFTNFFLPVMKLSTKTRNGSKVRKTYDPPTTPYQRVLLRPDISKGAKRHLRQQYRQLNPAQVRRQISQLQEKLFTLAQAKQSTLSKRRSRLLNKIFI